MARLIISEQYNFLYIVEHFSSCFEDIFNYIKIEHTKLVY